MSTFRALDLGYDALRRSRFTPRSVLYVAASFFTTWTLYAWLLRGDAPRPPLPDDFELSRGAQPIRPDAGSARTWDARAGAVRDAFRHAYHGWERYAQPADELLPLSEHRQNNFNGWGVSMFDSLDTMLLMDLREEFTRALPIIAKADWIVDSGVQAPFFETTIRYLGGLLSAYALSNEPILLEKADELGGLLSPAFETPSGFPTFSVSTVTGHGGGLETGQLAEIATCQLEYVYLAKLTGKKEYYDRANQVVQNLARANLTHTNGMMPTHWNLTSGAPVSRHLSVGAAADSAHEYLLKYYLLTAKTDKKSLEMYLRMTTEVMANLLWLSPTRKLLFVTDVNGSKRTPSWTVEHLSSFAAGLFALGAHILPLDDLESVGIHYASLAESLPAEARDHYAIFARYNLRDLHMWVAEGLGQAFWISYADQASGLGPEEIQLYDTARIGKKHDPHVKSVKWIDALERWRMKGKLGRPPGLAEVESIVYTADEKQNGPKTGRSRDYTLKKPAFLLRPETVESFYVLWRTTGDSKWRERGWEIFQAIEHHTKTRSGYACLRQVDYTPAPQKDEMPSFFLAETLKYLYLLFTDEDIVPLDKWVFNTEAHPFPVFEWTTAEKAKFGIS